VCGFGCGANRASITLSVVIFFIGRISCLFSIIFNNVHLFATVNILDTLLLSYGQQAICAAMSVIIRSRSILICCFYWVFYLLSIAAIETQITPEN